VRTGWWVVCISGGLGLSAVSVKAFTKMRARNVASREKTRREQIKANRAITIERIRRENGDEGDAADGGRGGS
jgi:hypothetical protein